MRTCARRAVHHGESLEQGDEDHAGQQRVAGEVVAGHDEGEQLERDGDRQGDRQVDEGPARRDDDAEHPPPRPRARGEDGCREQPSERSAGGGQLSAQRIAVCQRFSRVDSATHEEQQRGHQHDRHERWMGSVSRPRERPREGDQAEGGPHRHGGCRHLARMEAEHHLAAVLERGAPEVERDRDHGERRGERQPRPREASASPVEAYGSRNGGCRGVLAHGEAVGDGEGGRDRHRGTPRRARRGR